MVTSSDFTEDKDSGAYYISLISLQIERINKDVFPLFYQSSSLGAYIAVQNLEWRTGNIFIKPSLQDLIDYYINLTSFYNLAYANQVLIAAASEPTKLFWLANCLSASGLSVFSVDDKIYIIVQAIKESKAFALVNVANNFATLVGAGTPLSESDAEWISNITAKLILKIVESVTIVETQCDAFLKNLNTIGIYGISKDETLFEVIYNFLGDNQVGNIIGDNKVGRIVGGIFGNADNRRNFMNFLLRIWQTSIYNPYYPSPTYTLPANQDNVFPESYYMTDLGAAHYNGENATVLFVSENRYDVISFTQSFNFSIERNKIIAYEKTTTSFTFEGLPVSAPANDLYGTYDLYQPISITGFQPDLDISMPNTNCFPLFFLYFAIDYKDVKDADALIELAINVALNFTGIGEVADLEYLTYLKQISKFNALEDLEASKALLTWREVRGINEAVQFSAGNALAISNYLNTTTTDPGLKELTSYLDTFLGAVLLGSVCFHPIIKGKVTFAAKQVTEAYDGLPAELRSLLTQRGVSSDNIDAIRVFSDDATAVKVLKFSDNKELRKAILALNDEDIVRFLNDFANISDDLLLKLKDSPEYVEYWSQLSDVEKDAVNADKLTSFTSWYKNYVVTRAQRYLDTGIWIDVRRTKPGGKPVLYNPHEVETIVEIDIKFKAKSRPNGSEEAGDAIATSGLLKSKSYDPLGAPLTAFQKSWTKDPQQFIDQFLDAIDVHFNKIRTPLPPRPPLDIVVMDLKHFDDFDPGMRTTIMNKINSPTYEYKEYVNSNNLIIIN
ncbi:hypothetical protein [Mucilaginibacter sp. L3T2-6]|uniref:hypothetical protein n=1 Tax=Mucilaginibacter sp. L3T2-6 TaxID=3062491 RepID=UPI0026756D2F|nr:hypothetical protein [Mucilaginibacter sp. L3T2-6]MDO3641332.1 hypothetical protein [Mucilaginibacter sp. L3T2-6]MDV6213907.1 hypothetical protein [Mucilaginibacter sp. L3T2-6]